MSDPTRDTGTFPTETMIGTGTFNSAHLGRIRAQQRAELRALILFVLAALCLGAIIGLLIGYAIWGTVEVVCGG